MNSHSLKTKVSNTLPNHIVRTSPVRLKEGQHNELEYQILCCVDKDSTNKIIRTLGINYNIPCDAIRFDNESFYISTGFSLSNYKW